MLKLLQALLLKSNKFFSNGHHGQHDQDGDIVWFLRAFLLMHKLNDNYIVNSKKNGVSDELFSSDTFL